MIHNAEEHFKFLLDQDEFQTPSQEKENGEFQMSRVHFSLICQAGSATSQKRFVTHVSVV